MNCFMSYNPNVAKEVKITTWIKEFDGASPVYPSFPNEGDCFIVFDTDEAKEPSVNKTYTSGEWADTSSGGGGGGDFSIAEVTFINSTVGGQYRVDCMFADDTTGLNFQEVHVSTDAETAQVPIYKGIPTIILAQSFIGVQGVPTVTGDLELVARGIAVSGDGTITCAGQKGD